MTASTGEEKSGGGLWGAISRRLTLQSMVILGGVVLVLPVLLIALWAYFTARSDPATASLHVGIMRDILLTALALEGVLIVLAVVILILQGAVLFNLLRSDVKPMLQNLQETFTTAKGSAQFVGENLASPLIKAGGFFAGASVFLREAGGLRRALRRENNGSQSGTNHDR